MKTSIIEVGLPTTNVSAVLPALQQCLVDTGDALIGHQVYDDLTLFVVRLLGDTSHFHLKTLSAAFRSQQIDSFQLISCYLLKITFKDESGKNILRNFPLRGGESWFEAANDKKVAYLCLNSPALKSEQNIWLSSQNEVTQWANEA